MRGIGLIDLDALQRESQRIPQSQLLGLDLISPDLTHVRALHAYHGTSSQARRVSTFHSRFLSGNTKLLWGSEDPNAMQPTSASSRGMQTSKVYIAEHKSLEGSGQALHAQSPMPGCIRLHSSQSIARFSQRLARGQSSRPTAQAGPTRVPKEPSLSSASTKNLLKASLHCARS
jgi:hypothetical protein